VGGAPPAAAEEEFDEVCFEFGIELDDVTTEREMQGKHSGVGQDGSDGASGDALDEVLYKIDIPANRYDLLCMEGIARALNVFLGNAEIPRFHPIEPAAGRQQMRVAPETALIRPFVVCAVLRDVRFDPERYASFIELQDKLHTNICRQRTLVAIGTHDLDTLQGPFSYEALPPEDISFKPLKQEKEFRADDLMEFYKSDLKLRKFLPIISGSPVFPVIYDANRTVLSLPPIINGAHSAITLETKNVFIECTATDLTKAHIVLNTMCAMFSEYCSEPFAIEPVEVTSPAGEVSATPQLQDAEFMVEAAKVSKAVGHSFSADEVARMLRRMQLGAEVTGGGEAVAVKVPITRSDILHACDIYEDVAIGFGYNNIVRTIPKARTVGKELPINHLSELLRQECAMSGFTEILTWALISHVENFDNIRRADDGRTAVTLGNPKTAEFQECRTSLLPGALKTLGASKDSALPVKLFEVGEVVLLSDETDTGARNERRLVAVHSSKESGFEVVHGLLNRVMEVMGVAWEGAGGAGGRYGTYGWVESDDGEDSTFFAGRSARVSYGGQEIGSFGVLHPEVLDNFSIPFPTSALEIRLEPFCFDQFQKLLV